MLFLSKLNKTNFHSSIGE